MSRLCVIQLAIAWLSTCAVTWSSMWPQRGQLRHGGLPGCNQRSGRNVRGELFLARKNRKDRKISMPCKMAGFLPLLSCEVSAFIICCIFGTSRVNLDPSAILCSSMAVSMLSLPKTASVTAGLCTALHSCQH